MKTDGASGGSISRDLIPGLFLMGRWLRDGEVGAMEYWSVAPSANYARRRGGDLVQPVAIA